MDATERETLETALRLSHAGQPVVLVTLVEGTGSVPQKPGARLVVGLEGYLAGTVGGGKVEAAAIRHAGELLHSDQPGQVDLVHWNLNRDLGMTCGGAVRLFFEPLNCKPWTVAVFGAGHVAQCVVRSLLRLQCQVRCFDPREDWLQRLPASDKLQAQRTDELALQVAGLPEGTFIVSMTQGHSHDRPILQEALASERFPYVGVIGSHSKAQVLRRELVEHGLDATAAKRLRCPIGLALGSSDPEEIAISVTAELLQVRDQLRPEPPRKSPTKSTTPAP
ncbi:MAG: xanthine dehydrogenase accessory protein XdhC [Opitutales bacterium]